MDKDLFWAKVYFREFCAHYIKMSDGEIVQDVKESIIALNCLDSSGSSFGAKMVDLANQRLNGYRAKSNRTNGMKGGRPRKTQKNEPKADDVEKKAPVAAGNEKKSYGQFQLVALTDKELAALNDKLGSDTDEAIRILDLYKKSSGKTYRSDYAAILNWVVKRLAEDKAKGTAKPKSLAEHYDQLIDKYFPQQQEEGTYDDTEQLGFDS